MFKVLRLWSERGIFTKESVTRIEGLVRAAESSEFRGEGSEMETRLQDELNRKNAEAAGQQRAQAVRDAFKPLDAARICFKIVIVVVPQHDEENTFDDRSVMMLSVCRIARRA